ncbi:MAG: potassium transporter TrkH [Lachnospiraceae bacterium]|nr:potassium transporter TrkH [Lachnospiraceae bacterium]
MLKNIRISSVHFIPLSFLFMMIIGTILLLLPVSIAPGGETGIVTALFTSTTSVCVTGLVVKDTYSNWSVFGQTVILILVQIGGLGVVAVGSFIMHVGRKKFSLSERKLIGDSLNVEKNRGLLAFLTRIFKGVFLVEGIGTVLYAVKFIPRFGFGKGLRASLFQSVSAFCNAGMDIVGPNSMMEFRDSGYLMYVTMALIILGGIGFVVWFDVIDGILDGIKNHFGPNAILKHLSEHSKIVLVMTAFLLAIGTVIILAAEYDNPETIGNMGLSDKILNSLFQSVTFRTAGFASVPQEGLTETSCILGYILMFIGGSPVGTAGGVKTVTAFLVFMNAISYVCGEKENVVFKRRVSEEQMRKAAAVVFVSAGAIFVMTILLLSRGGITLTDALYEVISALATVGLSRSLTPKLDTIGRLIIIVSMYLGRIGPISMAIFFTKGNGAQNKIRHAEGTFYVG